LTTVEGLERQVVRSSGRIQGSGLRYLPVEHKGNQNSSPEEANVRESVVLPTSFFSHYSHNHGRCIHVYTYNYLVI
jgi:hypothetical protein